MTSTLVGRSDGQGRVVTGGAGGIGQRDGGAVPAGGHATSWSPTSSRRRSRRPSTRWALGDRVLGVTHDVRSLDDTQRLRDATLDRFGSVHVVCLNAGVAPVGPLFETPAEVWDWVFDVNVARRGARRAGVRAGPRRAGRRPRGLHRQHRGRHRHADAPALRRVEARGRRSRGGDAGRARRAPASASRCCARA